jgi:hypothetical protein
MHPSNPSAYGLRHDRKGFIIKAGKVLRSANTIPHGKDPLYNSNRGNQRETVRLADESVVAVMDRTT